MANNGEQEKLNFEKIKKEASEIVNRVNRQNKKLECIVGEGQPKDIPRLNSGSLLLNRILGGGYLNGGYPQGRIVEIFGPPSSAKTSMACYAIAEAQKQGIVPALVDAEHSFDPVWARKLGVNMDSLIVQQPGSGELGIQAVESLVEQGVKLIIVDSVAALTPQAEIDGDVGDSHVGLLARLMSQSMRKLNRVVQKKGATLIFINQIRMKIGVMYGNPETTPGGKALKFYASVRLRLQGSKRHKIKDLPVAQEIIARTVKNKTATPFLDDRLMFRFESHPDGPGIDTINELATVAISEGPYEKAGSWIKLGDETICQGQDAFEESMRNDSDFLEQVKQAVYGSDDE